MSSRPFVPAIAFGLLALFLAPWLPGLLGTGWLLYVLASLAIGLLTFGIVGYARLRIDSRYSLDALREIHESGGPPPDELPEVPQNADVVCPFCGEVYAARLLICPNCRR